MSLSNIRKALVGAAKSQLNTLGFTDKDIKWENVPFDPQNKPQWASVHFAPAEPFIVTLGAKGYDRVTGFLQIDLYVPQGTSVGKLDSHIDAFRASFKAGDAKTSGTTNVIILNCGVNGGMMFDNWYFKSLTIPFRADIPRT